MLFNCLRNTAENNPLPRKLGLKGRRNRNRIEHRVHRNAVLPALRRNRRTRQRINFPLPLHVQHYLLLGQGNPQLFKRPQQLGVGIGQAVQTGHKLRRRVVNDVLQIHRRILNIRPMRLLHGQQMAISLQAPFGHPLGLLLLRRDRPHHVLAQPGFKLIGLKLGNKAFFIVAVGPGFKEEIVLRLLVVEHRRVLFFGHVVFAQRPPGLTSITPRS